MKRWNRMVSILLVGATALTFTGCIDYDEPKGIESMRTAKAEFYSAQAALKLAEAKYKDAEAEIKLQELEIKKLEVALAAAKNESEIAQVSAKLEIALLDLKAAKVQKEADYQQALADLNMTVWSISSSYRAELNNILARIITNRESYNQLSEALIDNQQRLLEYTTSVDSAAIIESINNSISTGEKVLAIYEKEKALILDLQSANSDDASTKMADVYKLITNNISTYNANVAELAGLVDALAKKEAEYDALMFSQYSDKSLFNKDASVTFEVPAVIQNEFLVAVQNSSFSPNPFSTLWDKNAVVATRLSFDALGNEYFYYTLNGTSYTGKLLAANYVQNISYSQNPTKDLASVIGSIVKDGIQNTWGYVDITASELANLATQIQISEKDLKTEKDNYDAKLAPYAGAKAAYITARDAMQIHEYATGNNLTPGYSDYFNTLSTKISEYATLATPTEADKNSLVSLLKAYGKVREAFDGFVSKTINGTDKDYETIDAASLTSTLASSILGSSTWINNNEESAYGKFAKVCQELYGVRLGDVFLNLYTAEDLYKSAEAGLSLPTMGGAFSSYYYMYDAHQQLLKQQAWVDLEADVLVAMKPIDEAITAMDNKNQANAAALKPIEDELDNLNNRIGYLSSIGGQTAISLKVEVSPYSSNDGNLSLVGSGSGILYSSIYRLISYYNSLNTGFVNANSYTYWLYTVDQAISNAKEDIFYEKQYLALFKAGGYTDRSGEYLTKLIAECNSLEKEIKAKMEKLDTILTQLQKERDAIIAVMNGSTNE